MKIKLDESYSLTSDPYNIILNHVVKAKSGVERIEYTYYPTVQLAVKSYVQKVTRVKKVDSLEEYLVSLQEVTENIDKRLSKYAIGCEVLK